MIKYTSLIAGGLVTLISLLRLFSLLLVTISRSLPNANIDTVRSIKLINRPPRCCERGENYSRTRLVNVIAIPSSGRGRGHGTSKYDYRNTFYRETSHHSYKTHFMVITGTLRWWTHYILNIVVAETITKYYASSCILRNCNVTLF